ncbi:MAG: hypothetical protein RL090_100 [Bacteroidota bacterium]|jgi:hypothetical protein
MFGVYVAILIAMVITSEKNRVGLSAIVMRLYMVEKSKIGHNSA